MAVDERDVRKAPETEPRSTGLGLIKGLGVTLKHALRPSITQQYPRGQARPPAAHPRGHRAQGGELHRLLQVLARVPGLVHLHRRAQGDARARLRRQGPLDEGPGPVRDRLRALHVLRDLRGGLSLRRALLEPRVRVRRVRHRRAHAREGEARGVDVHGPAAADDRGGRGGSGGGTERGARRHGRHCAGHGRTRRGSLGRSGAGRCVARRWRRLPVAAVAPAARRR